MNEHSIVLLGGPDSGKTNYMSRLWLALNSKTAELVASVNPTDIKYVEGGAEHILGGSFAPRSVTNSLPGDFTLDILVNLAADPGGNGVSISVPDVSGEIWKDAIERGDVSLEWMRTLRQSSGALLFVRVLSNANVTPLDWVNSSEYLQWSGETNDDDQPQVPTQVALCEMLRFLDETLLRVEGRSPRVAVLITAWDLIDNERSSKGPNAFLREEYPLFAGRISDCTSLEISVFGVSVVGGDFADPTFTAQFQEGDINDMGYVAMDGPDGVVEKNDVTLPVAWVVGPLIDDE